MNEAKFVEKLYKSDPSVAIKCDILFDEEYQNSGVQEKINLLFENMMSNPNRVDI